MFKKILLATCCVVSMSTLANDKNVVKIVYSDFPPFEFKEAGHKNPVGLDAEIVTQVMDRIGYKVEFKEHNWNKVMELFEKGEADAVMSLRKSPERETKLLFTDPISYTQNYFFKNKNLDINATKVEELTKYNVGIINGYVYDSSFVPADFPKLSVINADKPELELLEKIKSGKVDMAICEINACSYFIHNNKEFANIDYMTNIKLGMVDNFYLAFNKKDSTRSNEIIQKFNAELTKFIAEGKRDELIKKYNFIKLN